MAAADLCVLLIGNGGREHALAWKLSQSPRVSSILAVPGNGGTAALPKVTNIPSLTVSADDFPGLVSFAQSKGVGLVVPGPEAPLVDGVEGFFRAAGIPCFGPSKEAARLEGSKTYSKDFMDKYNVPTAAYANFSDFEAAAKYVDTVEHDVVIKATGLAAGKGVIIPQDRAEARGALKRIMLDREFGSDAGAEVVVEELLLGDELSVLTFCDGYSFRSLPLAQDHKRIFDGDEGPNTGGMGCYAPTNIATPELVARIDREILAPTIEGMRRERQPFRGVLFTGLMITSQGPKVLEYNVRFGDPETQTVLPLLTADTDLAEVMLACAGGYLDSCRIAVDEKRFSATVVLAAKGYPGSYAKGTPMTVREPPAGSTIFHAGTSLGDNGQLKTSGGRVIAINSVGDSLRAAVDAAYAGLAAKTIDFEGMFFRKDIAHRAFRSSTATTAGLTYAQAGVDIQAGNEFVERIKNAVASTARPGADAEIGGFGGEVDLSKCGFGPSAPVIVGAIDGVGTKLMIAQAARDHSTVGIDLVAMNVNDLVVQGATPLMFLDYYGCSRLDPAVASSFVEGVAQGCRLAGCALVGGETAEMPGMYRDDDYDAAGCAVGTVTPPEHLPRLDAMAAGDVLLGLASSGVHSNGFSLVRRIISHAGLSYNTSPAPWATPSSTATIGASLLTPTRIYVRSLLPVLSKIHALAHITGGGLVENVPRALPPHLAAAVDFGTWDVPPVFRWLKTAGNVAPTEMVRTFNSGVGMVAVVSAQNADAVAESLRAAGETVYKIGQLVPRDSGAEGCVVRNLDAWKD